MSEEEKISEIEDKSIPEVKSNFRKKTLRKLAEFGLFFL